MSAFDNDPLQTDRGLNRTNRFQGRSGSGWILGAVVVLLIIAALGYSYFPHSGMIEQRAADTQHNPSAPPAATAVPSPGAAPDAARKP